MAAMGADIFRNGVQIVKCVPEEFRKMSLRSFAERAFAFSPLLLVAGFCIRCRLYSDSFEQVTQTSSQQAAVSAYIDPVRATIKADVGRASAATTRQVAQVWIDGWKSGKLRPMLPCASDDTMRGPIKSQIYAADVRVADRLIYFAKDEAQHGQKQQAADDVLTALRCVEIPKYSDPISVFLLADKQRFALRILDQIAPGLPVAEREKVKKELVDFKSDQASLAYLYHAMKFNSRYEAARASANATASYDQLGANAVGLQSDSTTFKGAVMQIQNGAKRILQTPYMQETKVAIRSQQRLATAIDKLIDGLNTTPSKKVV
jgi:hypothetical protein